mgnify:FL=1
MAKQINKLQKINKLEKEVYKLKNVIKGYQQAIGEVRMQRNKLINRLMKVGS